MKRLITAAAVSVTLMAAGCSSDSNPAGQVTAPTGTTSPDTSGGSQTETAYDGGLISDAGFKDGGEGWSGNALSVVDDGSGSNNVSYANVLAAGNSHDVNLSHALAIEQGKTYELSFKAKSSPARTMVVGIGLNKNPWTSKTENVSLTTDMQTHTLTILADTFGDEASRILFDMGAEVGEIWIDDVSLKEVTPVAPQLSQVDLPVNFEGNTVDYSLTDFGGTASSLVADPADAANMVVKTIKTGAAETWAGTTIGNADNAAADQGFGSVIPFTAEATTMSVKVFSPEAGTTVRLKVERSDNNEITAETEALTTVAGAWETLVFDLSNVAAGTAAFDPAAGYDKASIFFNFNVAGETAGEQTYYWDDVTFGGATTTAPPSNATEPTDAPAAPTAAASDVISIYSNAYTDITPVDTNPGWGQATVTTTENLAGNDVIKMSGLNYQGIDWASNTQDVSCFASLNVDYWTADADTLKVSVVGELGEAAYEATVAKSSWQNLTIPLSNYSNVGLNAVKQFKFEGSGTVFVDNLYFANTAGSGATCAAQAADPAPTDAPAAPSRVENSVTALYSDVYTHATIGDIRAGWSSASISAETYAGNEVQKMVGGYIGLEPAASIDGTGYSHLHIDVWAAEGTSILFKIRDYGANGTYDGGDDSEIQYTHTLGATSAWESVDIPLTNETKAALSQIVIDAQNAGSKIYFDNLYFY